MQFSNQFGFTNEKGSLELLTNKNILSARIDPASTENFLGATAVKLVDSMSSIPQVEKAAAGDDIFGFVVYSAKRNLRVAGGNPDILEVAFENSVMNMEAAAPILVGEQVEIVALSDQVTPVTTNTPIGIALSKASSAGDIIKVLIKTPGF